MGQNRRVWKVVSGSAATALQEQTVAVNQSRSGSVCLVVASFDIGSGDGTWAKQAGMREQLCICRLLPLNPNGGQ